MKKIKLFLFAIILLLTASCEKKSPVADYSLKHIKEPLSANEIELAFDSLGLKIERFEYFLPAKTQIAFFSQEYINGQSQNISHNSSLYLEKGKQEIIIFVYYENDSIQYSVQAGGGRVGCGSLNTKGFGGSTQGVLNYKELKSGPEIPLYIFAANKNSIESFSADDNIDDIVKKYELAFVLYADVQ
jgi:hypothetical protein